MFLEERRYVLSIINQLDGISRVWNNHHYDWFFQSIKFSLQKGHVHFFTSQSSTHSIPHSTQAPLPLWKMCPHGKTRMKSLSSYRSVQIQQQVCDSLCSSMEISDTRHTLSSYASTND